MQTRKIAELKPYENNARTHSKDQIKEIARSITEFGFNNPVLIDEKNNVIAGHGRILAAGELGLDNVPVMVLGHLSDVKKKAYILADNRIALNAGWSPELLKLEFDSLVEEGFDVSLTGFTQDEIEAFMYPEVLADGQCDSNDVPAVPDVPVTNPGDVWLLGNHRLMCGDSTSDDCVSKLYGGNSPKLMVTDPPYGVNYDPEWRDGCDLGVGERSKGKVENDDRVDWSEAYALFSGDIAYIWHAGVYSPAVGNHLLACGYDLVSQIIWVKQHFALSRGDYHWQHEPCWYAVKKGKKHNWQGARDQATTWQIKNNNSFGNANKEETWGHGTQKPIECMLRPIQNNSKPKDYVYDPFGGSGTTLIACEKLGRKCLMMELSPQYCDVIVNRWQKFTGQDAILENEEFGGGWLKFNEAKDGREETRERTPEMATA